MIGRGQSQVLHLIMSAGFVNDRHEANRTLAGAQ
jgi:hypothetical protein